MSSCASPKLPPSAWSSVSASSLSSASWCIVVIHIDNLRRWTTTFAMKSCLSCGPLIPQVWCLGSPGPSSGTPAALPPSLPSESSCTWAVFSSIFMVLDWTYSWLRWFVDKRLSWSGSSMALTSTTGNPRPDEKRSVWDTQALIFLGTEILDINYKF